MTDQSEIIAFLADPATHGGRQVTRIDTHGAVVFLVGDRAFKLKRAVDFPYMDFSTLARREAACRREVSLNRRTAPDLYLGIRRVIRAGDGRLALTDAADAADADVEADGDALEWLVEMRRFDQAALLSDRADRGLLDAPLIDQVIDATVDLHAQAERRPAEAAASLRWIIDDNIEEMADATAVFPADRLDRLAALARPALDRLSDRIDRRLAAGSLRQCHGDLHLRNLILQDDRVVLFDAIEFNDKIANVDVWYDVAYLIMDLWMRGLGALANRAVNLYLDRTGDFDGVPLVPLFLSTRAAVRAKVMASAVDAQADAATGEAIAGEARAYLEAATAFIAPVRPKLVAVGGLSGTGKSTLARRLAPRVGRQPGAVVLRSDVVRKHLKGCPLDQPLPATAYDAETTAAVYQAIRRRAADALAEGLSVIADAVFAGAEERVGIEAEALKAGAQFAGLWLEAPVPLLEERLAMRAGDASDADGSVLRRQLAYDLGRITWAHVPALGQADHVRAVAETLL